jgi:hypothetical protein
MGSDSGLAPFFLPVILWIRLWKKFVGLENVRFGGLSVGEKIITE